MSDPAETDLQAIRVRVQDQIFPKILVNQS